MSRDPPITMARHPVLCHPGCHGKSRHAASRGHRLSAGRELQGQPYGDGQSGEKRIWSFPKMAIPSITLGNCDFFIGFKMGFFIGFNGFKMG